MADGKTKVTPAAMKLRTKQFALRVLKLTRALPRQPEAQAVRNQLVRSATSVAANYRAAQRARSKAEFCAKLGVVEEEIDESVLWLEIFVEDGMLPEGKVAALLEEANEIAAIIVAALTSALRSIRHPPSAIRHRTGGRDAQ